MITYNSLLRDIAIQCNALGGTTTPDVLNSVYDSIPLTEANFTSSTASSIFPFNFLKTKMIAAQEALIFAIASTEKHPFREALITQTANQAYGSLLTTNSAGLPIIGVYGAVRDAIDNEPCSLNELEQIRIRHQSSWMLLSVYEYAIFDKRIYHTRANVIVDVCTYQRPNVDMLDLTSNIILSDVLGEAIVDGAVMLCFRDDEYLEQAARAGQLFNAWLTAIQSGQMVSQAKAQTNPTPDAQRAYAA